MTTQIKVVLAVMGFVTVISVVSAYESHVAESGVVAELKRENQERLQERQRDAAERARAALKQQQDEAAAAAYLTQPSRISR